MNNTNDSAIITSDKIPLFNERYEFKAEALSMLHEALQGKVFAFAGHTNLLSRLDFEELIKHCSGEHTKRLTKRTNYLIKGERLDVNDVKICDQAVHKGILIISPKEFFQLLTSSTSAIDIEGLLQPDFQHQISFDRESIRKYSLELSPNGKAKCVHCHKNIKKGEPRIRVCFRPPDDWVYHRCLSCLTEQILANIIAEWSEYPDPMKAFVEAQPFEVISYFQTMNPARGQGLEGELLYVIQKLHQYAEEELTVVGDKRPLTTLREGDTIIVPVGKKSKFPSEGIHESLKEEIETFLQNLPPNISNVIKTRTTSAIQPTDNLDQVENRLGDENILPGSAGQTDVTAAMVKTSANYPEGSSRRKMNVSVKRSDRSHLVE